MASNRTTVVRLLALISSALLSIGTALAQPAKPIHLLVGFPAGGGTDSIARTLAERLKDELGAPVLVEITREDGA